ncbi:MAG TPA: M56 family metallopeptidase [Acidobacteriaceae bacterium]
MHDLVLVISGWAIHYLVHSALTLAALGAAAWVGDRLLRRVGPETQHRMWVAALLMGVLLPLVPAGWMLRVGDAATGAANGSVTVTYHVIAATAERWTALPLLREVLGWGYLLSVVFWLMRLLWRCGRTWAMVRRSVPLMLDTRAEQLLEHASRRAGVALPRVRCSAGVWGPAVLGWRPLLLVPEGFFEVPEEDIAAALAHEYAHIARRDFAKNLVYEIAAATVAYHPATWLMRRRIAETREMVCDEMAAGPRENRADYAASLLRLAQLMATPAVGTSHAIGVFDGDMLEERIMRLAMDVPKVSRMRKAATAAAVACVLVGGAVSAAALSFDVMPQTNSSKAGHEKIYKVGNGVTAPVLVHAVDAEFSKKAKDAKYQGVSVVSCVVDTNGMPQHVHTVRKLGMGLDEKAIEAVRQYRFKPSILNGQPVAVAITIEVNFRIY